MTDAELLHRFAEDRSQEAFTELVRRHIDLVYTAALRHVAGDRHRAEDITQEVFATLARKADQLTRHPALAGWLYSAARFAAATARRGERRRNARETAAHLMHHNSEADGAGIDWERISPLLDDALVELAEDDRQSVLLRFFGRKSFAAIAGQLGISENAAQKRVDRALDRLNASLARRGITSTAVALGAAMSQAAVSAPQLLLPVVEAAARAAAAAGAKGFFTSMSTSTIIAGLSAALIFGLGATQWSRQPATVAPASAATIATVAAPAAPARTDATVRPKPSRRDEIASPAIKPESAPEVRWVSIRLTLIDTQGKNHVDAVPLLVRDGAEGRVSIGEKDGPALEWAITPRLDTTTAHLAIRVLVHDGQGPASWSHQPSLVVLLDTPAQMQIGEFSYRIITSAVPAPTGK